MSHFTKEFQLKGAGIKISVPTIQTRENTLVKTDEYRPFPSVTDPDISDWCLDTQYLLDQLSATPCTLNDYKQALIDLCVKHINQYGRLLDSDLYSYIDETVLIVKCAFELEGATLSKDNGLMCWEGMKKAVVDNLSDYIFINVPTGNTASPSMLVKLAQYESGDF